MPTPEQTTDEKVYVRFTKTHQVQDTTRKTYVKGEVYALKPDSAQHFTTRGIAEEVGTPTADTLPPNIAQEPRGDGDEAAEANPDSPADADVVPAKPAAKGDKPLPKPSPKPEPKAEPKAEEKPADDAAVGEGKEAAKPTAGPQPAATPLKPGDKK